MRKKLLLFSFLIFTLLSVNVRSQTTIINPATIGGFEVGDGSFTANGWTVANGTILNKWYTGTVPTGFTNRAAYISNDGGVSWAYPTSTTADATTISVVHFYRDITIPAGETKVVLSFDWQAKGEVSTSVWDALLVGFAPTTFTPEASNVNLGGANPTGITNIGEFHSADVVQHAVITLPNGVLGNCTSAVTVRLVFTWKNDDNTGFLPPAAIDNISLVSSLPTPSRITSSGGIFSINPSLPNTGSNFTTFTEAVNELNLTAADACNSFSSGITFNVAADAVFTENVPVINAGGTATSPIVFQKSGTGANPLIMPASPGTIASSTTVGGNGDGIIVINGGDYITFNAIDLNSNSFSSGADMYEYGYYLKKASATNACKNVTIKNAVITLNKLAVFSFGIFVSNFVGTTAATVTSTGGRSENIKLNGNTIANSYGGIQLRGFAAVTPFDFYDQNIEIGVDSANSITNFGGGGSTAYGIYTIYQNNLKIAKNIIVSAAGTVGIVYGIFTTTATNASADIYSNTITVHGGGTTQAIYGISSAMGGTGTSNQVDIYNNTITNCTYPTATTGDIQGILQSASAYKAYIYGNTISNNTLSSTGAGIFYGIYQSGAVVNESRIYSNNIINNTRSAGTTGAWYGINNSPAATANCEVYGNTVADNTISVGTTGIMYGIAQTAGLTTNIYKNTIRGMINNSTGIGGVYGLSVTAGTTNNVYNNFISDLNVSQATGTTVATSDIVRGINVNYTTATTSINVSHNTIYLNASSTGTNFGSTGIFHTTSTTATTAALTLRNNIVVNISTANGLGRATAYRRSSTTLTNYGSTSNNNNFYVGSSTGANGIFYDGTNLDDIAAYKARVAPRDNNTLSENVPFVNIASIPYDLHISTTIPTQLESGGVGIASITQDFDGDARSATTPDIGADEFIGLGADLSSPIITYTALPVKGLCIDTKTITANIVDASNINVTANLKPRLWYKKETEADVLPATNTAASNGWKWVEASNAVSPFTFTLNYSLLSSAVTSGDSLSYFVVAQDRATVPNVGVKTAILSNMPATVALSSASFPTSGAINGFRILNIPTPLSIKTNRTELCVSGTVTLDIDGIDITGGQFQWQSTHHNTSNWVDIPAATTVPYTTGVFSDSKDFRLIVRCGGTPISSSPSNIVSVSVNNPQIASTTGATRCGTGTVNLAATAASGFDIKWYENATSVLPIGSGTTFTTPSVSATKTFYAAASAGGNTVNTGLLATSTGFTSGGGTTNFGLVFDALSPFILSAVTIYPVSGTANTASTVTIDVVDGTNAIVHTATVNVIGNPAASATPQVVNLNFNILPGTNYKLRPGSFGSGISGLMFGPTAAAPSGANYGYPFIVPGVLSINSSTLTTAPANTARPDLYYYFFNWEVTVGCVGTRVPVIATVTTPPALTLSGNKTICNNAVDSLVVTSTPTDFNTFTWSPTTDLYTDFACTVPYTGTNALKVYVKSSTQGKTGYKCTANNTASFCANEVVDSITVMPNPTISASPTDFCVSGITTLSASALIGYGSGSLQWQSSPTGVTYSNIASANNATYTTPINATTYYTLIVKNGVGASCPVQPLPVTINVNSPQIASTTPAFTCGQGTVTLGATAPGYDINWYGTPIGGSVIGNGTTFTTPLISASTTYYAAAVTPGAGTATTAIGAGATTSATYSNPFYSLWSNLHNQHLILASELSTAGITAGDITNLAIDITAAGTLPMLDLSVKMANTTATTMSAYVAPTFTTVYTAASLMPVLGLNTLTFTTPFTWDGVSNIVVEICHGNPSSTATMSRTAKMDATSYISTIHTHRTTATAGSVQCGDVTTTLTTYSTRPQFTFTYSTGCIGSRTAVIATVDNTPGCSTVPVSLLNFRGERQGNNNLLSWTTVTELNNAGFELQRSADGINFSKLIFVESKASNGNSNGNLNYLVTDTKSLISGSYYRLKQIDKDGKSTLSPIVFIKGVKVSKLELVSVYPNPVVNVLNISLVSPKADNVTFVVSDVTGKVIIKQVNAIVNGDNNIKLNVANLAKGVYTIKAICTDGCETAISKFVKE